MPVHVVATQIGAYMNVLAPFAFLLLCVKLFDRWTAFYATAAFLFLTSLRNPEDASQQNKSHPYSISRQNPEI